MKKKILHISMIAPSCRAGGGGMGIYQSCMALSAAGEADYCGPLPEEGEALPGSYCRVFPLTYTKSLRDRIAALLHLAPCGAYASFRRQQKALSQENYDIAYIDASRQGYAARFCRRRGMRVMLRMHNIERDYYRKELSLTKTPFMYLKYRMAIFQERRSLSHADSILFITEKDLCRAKELYPNETRGKDLSVMPICLPTPEEKNFPRPIEGEYLLITGSLWFGPNLEGIFWFLRAVWPALAAQFPHLSLLIAGHRPAAPLCEAAMVSPRTVIIDSPPDMAPYFRHAALYIAPMLDGAGMKVKVAEALSYGLPVVGTSHVFIGYRDLSACTAVADTADDFIRKTAEKLRSPGRGEEKEAAFSAFCRHYTMDAARRTVAEQMEML